MGQLGGVRVFDAIVDCDLFHDVFIAVVVDLDFAAASAKPFARVIDDVLFCWENRLHAFGGDSGRCRSGLKQE